MLLAGEVPGHMRLWWQTVAPVSAALAADAAGEDEGVLQKIIFKAVIPHWRWQRVLFTVPAPDS